METNEQVYGKLKCLIRKHRYKLISWHGTCHKCGMEEELYTVLLTYGRNEYIGIVGGIQCGFVGPQWLPVSREVPPSLQKLETLAVVLSCHLRSFPIHVALLEFNQIEKICRGSKLCLEYHEVCVKARSWYPSRYR